MMREALVSYHRNDYAPLFSSLPEVKRYVRRYVQSHATGDQLPGLPDNRIDGLTELWFDDPAGLAGVFSSENYLKTVRPDEEKFLDLQACECLLGSEHEVIKDVQGLGRPGITRLPKMSRHSGSGDSVYPDIVIPTILIVYLTLID